MIANSIGLKAVPQIPVDIGQIIMKIPRYKRVTVPKVMGIKNDPIILKWQIRKPYDVVMPTLVAASRIVRFTAARVTQMPQRWDKHHQIKKLSAGIDQEMAFLLGPCTETLHRVHQL